MWDLSFHTSEEHTASIFRAVNEGSVYLRNVGIGRNSLEHHHLFGYYPSICLEELKKTTKILSRDRWSAGPEPPEYKAGILTIRPRPFVAKVGFA
jgi:hypothetical protein